eukprot:350384-Chlamydomonas_euryale.AAC.1
MADNEDPRVLQLVAEGHPLASARLIAEANARAEAAENELLNIQVALQGLRWVISILSVVDLMTERKAEKERATLHQGLSSSRRQGFNPPR